MERKSGVLMHISSLPSDHGIGTLGKEAYNFVDFLHEAHQTYWQILPLSQTGFGDSPYQSVSTFAGNPYFIDLDMLCDDGLLAKEDYLDIDWKANTDSINYGVMFKKRYPVLRKAVSNLFKTKALDDYYDFCHHNSWVEDYALFMAIKTRHGNVGLSSWDRKFRLKDKETIDCFCNDEENRKEIDFWKGVQYLFFCQWFSLKEYANSRGISIIGDCPIYVAEDSCDLWSHPDLFQVDKDLKLIRVAGCPPDGFSPRGQLWGNPLYKWEEHKKDNYSWWVSRISHLCMVYDYVRIDHFRGLASYYSIDADAEDALDGKWVKGPSKDLIRSIRENVGENIIAEDLGYMDDEVKDLLNYSKFPGMNVMEFGFDSRDADSNDNIPYNFRKNSVVYCGTHDNETIMGWIHSIPEDQLEYCKEYMNAEKDSDMNWAMIRCLFESNADTAIVQAQDLLGLDNSARMNKPSTLGNNWKWRAEKGVFNKKIADKLKKMSHTYGRA